MPCEQPKRLRGVKSEFQVTGCSLPGVNTDLVHTLRIPVPSLPCASETNYSICDVALSLERQHIGSSHVLDDIFTSDADYSADFEDSGDENDHVLWEDDVPPTFPKDTAPNCTVNTSRIRVRYQRRYFRVLLAAAYSEDCGGECATFACPCTRSCGR